MPATHSDADARPYVEELLQRAVDRGASDIHLEPIAGGLEVRFRIDGLLEKIEQLPEDLGRHAVLRLMVLAQLLTYRQDIPQEGRIRTTLLTGNGGESGGPEGKAWSEVRNPRTMDLRLAIMPVAHGLRAVVRLPADLMQPRTLEKLDLPSGCLDMLCRFARTDAGMLLVTGPAGSGKTTTIYALLEHIATIHPGLSIIALEDPIERLLPGVTQIEVTPHGQLTYERALKSILRQDPQVLMLGEIRDAGTASLAVQAALSGHRLIATLHAGDPATAIARLLEMGLEPYQITSSLYGVLTQRLVRRKAGESYQGRLPLAEFAILDAAARAAVLRHADAETLRAIIAQSPGHTTLRAAAEEMVRQGQTDSAEVQRALGD